MARANLVIWKLPRVRLPQSVWVGVSKYPNIFNINRKFYKIYNQKFDVNLFITQWKVSLTKIPPDIIIPGRRIQVFSCRE